MRSKHPSPRGIIFCHNMPLIAGRLPCGLTADDDGRIRFTVDTDATEAVQLSISCAAPAAARLPKQAATRR